MSKPTRNLPEFSAGVFLYGVTVGTVIGYLAHMLLVAKITALG